VWRSRPGICFDFRRGPKKDLTIPATEYDGDGMASGFEGQNGKRASPQTTDRRPTKRRSSPSSTFRERQFEEGRWRQSSHRHARHHLARGSFGSYLPRTWAPPGFNNLVRAFRPRDRSWVLYGYCTSAKGQVLYVLSTYEPTPRRCPPDHRLRLAGLVRALHMYDHVSRWSGGSAGGRH
jgi:hypothetical protein